MSAQAKTEAPDLVTIEIDGRELKAPKNAMIIEVADEAGIDIPRFCYHKKLSIAANCRMCLVEVEKASKPLPACATPVMDGMKVYTESPRARSAQKGVMEFLLINHPLDCPICDQGGECELQDLAMGYGRSVSRFSERKRVVKDKNVGPLIQTDMTRCIQCTRCVRFLEEIADTHELGGVGRGENLEITTYVERAIESELSGNIIDLCPVGALTDKPYRYTARAWELIAEAGVSTHDAVGSNLWVHRRRGDAMRIVPRGNESLNETWLSDRDRFGFRGLGAMDRVAQPMIRDDRGRWRETDWETALQATLQGLQKHLHDHADRVGFLASARCTVEELYLIQKLARTAGSPNVDHRLRQTDFSDQDAMPLHPALGLPVAELENVDAALLIGSNLAHDQPILALRLRKACDRGARVMAVNPVDYRFHFDLAEKIIVDPFAMVDALIALARAVAKVSGARPGSAAVRELLKGVKAGDVEMRMAETLVNANNGAVLFGNFAWQHPHAAHLRALARFITEACGCSLSCIPESANSAGAWIVGAVPHRGPGGEAAGHQGLSAAEMLAEPLRAYALFDVDAGFDTADPSAARAALEGAGFVVHVGPFADTVIRDCANVLLPAATPPETDGTYVNAQVDWQMFGVAATPPGEARPLWKILRMLGTGLGLNGFGYLHLDQVRNEIRSTLEAAPEFQAESAATGVDLGTLPKRPQGLVRTGDVPIYATDSLVRRSAPLQEHPLGERVSVRMNPADGEKLGVGDGDTVTVDQDGHRALAVASIDDAVPAGSVRVPAGVPGSETLGASIGPINVIK